MCFNIPTEANNLRQNETMNTFNITKIKSAFLENSKSARILEVKLEGVSRRDNRDEHRKISKELSNLESINYNLSMAISLSKKMEKVGREYLNVTINDGVTIDFLEAI